MKRLCIYLTYDKQKIIDKYIGYMLGELKTCVDYLVVICNGEEILSGLNIIMEFADEIFYRRNFGFDAGGFKDALCEYIGWDKVLQYDELVLVNDSMYGPLRTMKSIFSEMKQRSVDFWGLAIHGEGKNHFVGYVPEHIQSYFLVIGARMLHSSEFMNYWVCMPYFKTFKETIMQYEIGFTRYFSNLGYTYDALADTKINDSMNLMNNYSKYALIPFEMMAKRDFPFLKKQPFSVNTLYCQTQQNLKQSIDYIDKETNYDVNLIWENIIRIHNMADLQQTLHLQYIVFNEEEKNLNVSVAIVVFLEYKESSEYVLEYLKKINRNFSINIFAEKGEYLEDYIKHNYICKVTDKEAFAELLLEFAEYDYVCVLHDTDVTSKNEFSCVGKSYFYNVWENLLKDNNHVIGVIECFEKNSFLGFLTSPQPNFGKYFGEYGRNWYKKFKVVQRVIDDLEINCQISEIKPPFRITNNFWIRGCVLNKLKNIKRNDVLYLEFLWSYLAQDAGYYSGIVETVEYASMNEVNLQYYLYRIADHIRGKCGNFHNYGEMLESLRICGLENFCRKCSKIMVYGVGEEARARKNLLPNVDVYVVSDCQEKPQNIDGIPVKYLSEIQALDDYGIILCMNRENQLQVIPLLEARGFENYFCI